VFVLERMITVDADSAQFTHDALLTAWPRLRAWIEDNAEALRARRRIAEGDAGDQPPVRPYPLPLPACYARRLEDMGARRYGAVGVARDDRDARARVRAGNWECWGAATALFCYLDRSMLPPQWMDAGMFLQSVMLLARAEGMDSCPQIAWAEYHQTVAEVIRPPDTLALACGMSIGYADPDIPRPAMPRMLLSEAVTFAC